MDTWIKYTLGAVIPAFGFLIIKDTAGQFYGKDRGGVPSYVVDVPESQPDPQPAPEPAPVVAEAAPIDPIAPSPDVVATIIADAPPQSGLTAADMTAAAQAARACASCHQFERDRNGAGPHLVGIGGRTIGAVEGFRYSDALQGLNADGAVWTVEALAEWLAGPGDYAPGTKMNFAVSDAEERRLIAQWLVQKDQ